MSLDRCAVFSFSVMAMVAGCPGCSSEVTFDPADLSAQRIDAGPPDRTLVFEEDPDMGQLDDLVVVGADFSEQPDLRFVTACDRTAGVEFGAPWPTMGCCPSHQAASQLLGPKMPNVKWSAHIRNDTVTGAVVGADGTVYYMDPDNFITAVDGVTGAMKWQYMGGPNFTSGGLALGANGLLYGASSGDGSGLHAVSTKTGLQAWSFPMGGLVLGTPAIGPDGTVYIGSNTDGLFALDGLSGKKKWNLKTPTSNSAAVGADGTVYVALNDNQLHALDAATGADKWTFPDEPFFAGEAPVVGPDGTVYNGDFNAPVLHAIDGVTGIEKWTFRTNGGHVLHGPAIGPDNTVYVLATDASVYAVAGATGKQKWMFQAQGFAATTPALDAGGTLYVAAHGLYALDAKTGMQKWVYPTQFTIGCSPSIGPKGLLYTSSGDTDFLAIGP